MPAHRGIYQLGVNAHTVARLTYAALHYVSHPQLAAHLSYLYCLALVGEDRVARDDKHAREFGQVSDEVLSHAVAEILLLRVATHIGKGQDSYRRLIEH